MRHGRRFPTESGRLLPVGAVVLQSQVTTVVVVLNPAIASQPQRRDDHLDMVLLCSVEDFDELRHIFRHNALEVVRIAQEEIALLPFPFGIGQAYPIDAQALGSTIAGLETPIRSGLLTAGLAMTRRVFMPILSATLRQTSIPCSGAAPAAPQLCYSKMLKPRKERSREDTAPVNSPASDRAARPVPLVQMPRVLPTHVIRRGQWSDPIHLHLMVNSPTSTMLGRHGFCRGSTISTRPRPPHSLTTAQISTASSVPRSIIERWAALRWRSKLHAARPKAINNVDWTRKQAPYATSWVADSA